MGTGFDLEINAEEVGVILRAVNQIFTGIEERRREDIERNEPSPQYELTAQFLEVWQYIFVGVRQIEHASSGLHNMEVLHFRKEVGDTCMYVYTEGLIEGFPNFTPFGGSARDVKENVAWQRHLLQNFAISVGNAYCHCW